MSTKQTGDLAEQLATEYLENHGLSIIERNFHTRYGEIDLVADDRGTRVIVEVRAKKNESSGLPIEAVHYYKQRKVLRMAKWYLMEHKLSNKPARIDVIGVTLTRPPKIQWIKNAIESNY